MNNFTVKTLNDFQQFPSHYKERLDLLLDCHFDQSLTWYELFAKHILADNQKLIIICIEKNGIFVAYLPLYTESKKTIIGTVTSLLSLSNYFSAHFEPIIISDDKKDILALFVEEIKKMKWDMLDINPLLHSDPLYDEFKNLLTGKGLYVESYMRFANWNLNLKERSYEEYINTIPQNIRSLLKRKYKKLKKIQSYRFEIILSEDNLESAVADYNSVYRKRWGKNEFHRNFIIELLRKFARLGWLRLGLIYIDDKPVATQIWFVCNRKAYIFKLAHDRDYQKLSIGTALTANMFEFVIDTDHVELVDYLCGDEHYKKNWMNLRNEMWGIRAHRTRGLRFYYIYFHDWLATVFTKIAKK